MREIGIDLGGVRPSLLTDELARQAQVLVTMGCGSARSRARAPGLAARRSQGRSVEEVRRIREEIRSRVAALVRERGWGQSGG